jgi:hypothetical protein
VRRLFSDEENLDEGGDGSGPEDSDSSGAGRKSTIHISCGNFEFSPEEFIACQVAVKMSSNMTDACFRREINLLASGLTDKRHGLPTTRHKVDKCLKQMSKIKPTWAAYCPKCHNIISETKVKPKDAICKGPNCNKYSLKKKLAKNQCVFLYMSIKDQIKGYLKNKNFRHVLRKFRRMKGSHLNGKLHKGLIEAGHFDLSFGIDAGQMHNFTGKQILPAVLFFNNLPVSWQLRFPILAALWTGKSGKKYQPPRNVFLQRMQEELRELGKPDGEIVWRDGGNEFRSSTYLTMVLSDGPEKAELLNQIGCSGKYSCPFCFAMGRTLYNDEEFGPIFSSDNHFRKTGGSDSVRGIRFPKLMNTKVYRWRDSKGRLTMGKKAALKRIQTKNTEYHKKGIKGLPVLRNLPGTFLETDSHVSDTLHLIAHGVFHDILSVMVHGKRDLGNTFIKSGGGGEKEYAMYDEMMESMSKTSESDRNCRSLENFSEWKAYDCFQFLLHHVGQLCSNEEVIMKPGLYKSLVYLSNMVYLSHYGRMDDNIIDKHSAFTKKFCEVFIATLTEEYNTYKVHIATGHGGDMLIRHGCACYTDGFNLERFISVLKKLCTTNKLEMQQQVRNFFIKHQSTTLQNMENFVTPGAKETLNQNGFFSEEFFCKFDDTVKTAHQQKAFPKTMKKLLDNFIDSKLNLDLDEVEVTRVTQMIRKSIILETKEAKHRPTTKINDSYIQVDEEGIFGQIVEIAHLPDSNQFLFVVEKFKRLTEILDKKGAKKEYPINQIPFEQETVPSFHVFVLTDDLFVQKAQVSTSNCRHEGSKIKFFSVYPNEWFRY